MPLLLYFLVGLVLLTQTVWVESHSAVNHVLINEIQTDGAVGAGGSGDDWVEFYNPTDCPVDLSSWSIQRKSSTGTLYKKNFDAGLTIPAHGFLLVAYTTANVSPAPDMRASAVSLSSTGATIYLVNDQQEITGTFDPNVVDLVGYGAPYASDGSPAPVPPEAQSISRTNSADTDNNAADFVVQMVPTPQNSLAPPVSSPGACTAPPSPPPPPPPGTSPTPTPPPPGQVAGEGVVAIAEARRAPNGQAIVVSGIVTTRPGQLSVSSFYMQDETGGLQIYSSKKLFPQLTIGNTVMVRGELSEAFSEKRLKIDSVSDITVSGTATVDPREERTGDVGEEDEGQLLIIFGAVTETSGDTFFIDDGSGPMKIYIKKETGIDKPRMRRGNRVTVVGIVSQYRDQYRLLPREQGDLRVGTASFGDDSDEEEGGSSQKFSGSGGQIAGAKSDLAGALDTLSPTSPSVTFGPRSNNFRALPTSLRGLGWAGILLGVLLLLLIPLLVWEKKNGWFRTQLGKLKNFFKH